ncbi:MAG: ankyrin repeat domain-containing protein [Oceanipulchritudo sp.]
MTRTDGCRCRARHSLALVDLLINAGADVNLRDIDGTTPLRSATRAGHSHIAQRFWEAGTNGGES